MLSFSLKPKYLGLFLPSLSTFELGSESSSDVLYFSLKNLQIMDKAFEECVYIKYIDLSTLNFE